MASGKVDGGEIAASKRGARTCHRRRASPWVGGVRFLTAWRVTLVELKSHIKANWNAQLSARSREQSTPKVQVPAFKEPDIATYRSNSTEVVLSDGMRRQFLWIFRARSRLRGSPASRRAEDWHTQWLVTRSFSVMFPGSVEPGFSNNTPKSILDFVADLFGF